MCIRSRRRVQLGDAAIPGGGDDRAAHLHLEQGSRAFLEGAHPDRIEPLDTFVAADELPF